MENPGLSNSEIINLFTFQVCSFCFSRCSKSSVHGIFKRSACICCLSRSCLCHSKLKVKFCFRFSAAGFESQPFIGIFCSAGKILLFIINIGKIIEKIFIVAIFCSFSQHNNRFIKLICLAGLRSGSTKIFERQFRCLFYFNRIITAFHLFKK